MPETKPYGIYFMICPACKWRTLNKQPSVASCCEACRFTPGPERFALWEFTEHVAEQVASLSEEYSAAIRAEADKHGYMIFKKSKNTFQVFEKSYPTALRYRGVDKPEGRAYFELRCLITGTWKEVTSWLYKNVKEELPAHLIPKEKK